MAPVGFRTLSSTDAKKRSRYFLLLSGPLLHPVPLRLPVLLLYNFSCEMVMLVYVIVIVIIKSSFSA